jgi:hypothetical protein
MRSRAASMSLNVITRLPVLRKIPPSRTSLRPAIAGLRRVEMATTDKRHRPAFAEATAWQAGQMDYQLRVESFAYFGRQLL